MNNNEKIINLNIRKNVMYSLGEFFINTVLLFVGYKLILGKAGIEAVGVWSVVYSLVNIVRIGDCGVSGAAVKYISEFNLVDDKDKIIIYGQTAILTGIAQFSFLAIVANSIILLNINRLVGVNHAKEATLILPWVLIGFVLFNISGTMLGIIQGLHMGYKKSQLSVFGTIVQIIFVVAFVPKYGLIGMAAAQIAQHMTLIILNSFYISNVLGKNFLLLNFNKNSFYVMIKFSLKAQLVNVSNGIVEPISKILVGHFGGMAVQGIFELAHKTVLISRNMVVSGVSAASPAISRIYYKKGSELSIMYKKMLKITGAAMLCVVAVNVVLAPFLSEIWLGYNEKRYEFFVVLMSGAFLFNVLGVPSYIIGMASGNMKGNICVSIMTLLFVIIFGIIGGIFGDGEGVVIAISIGIGASGISIAFINRKIIKG